MKKLLQYVLILMVIIFMTLTNISAEEITVPLTNSGAPCIVKANLHRGGITIKGYNGKVVLIKAHLKAKTDDDEDY